MREWVNSGLISHQHIGHTETRPWLKVSSERLEKQVCTHWYYCTLPTTLWPLLQCFITMFTKINRTTWQNRFLDILCKGKSHFGYMWSSVMIWINLIVAWGIPNASCKTLAHSLTTCWADFSLNRLSLLVTILVIMYQTYLNKFLIFPHPDRSYNSDELTMDGGLTKDTDISLYLTLSSTAKVSNGIKKKKNKEIVSNLQKLLFLLQFHCIFEYLGESSIKGSNDRSKCHKQSKFCS